MTITVDFYSVIDAIFNAAGLTKKTTIDINYLCNGERTDQFVPLKQ